MTIHLDQLSIPPSKPFLRQINRNEMLISYEIEYCLFDYKNYQRTISGTKLLSCKNIKETNTVIDRLAMCNCVWIILDFWSEIKDANKLFLKRCLQIMELIDTVYPGKKLGLLVDTALADYSKLIDEFYAT